MKLNKVGDTRGFREWTSESREKVRKSSMRHFQLNNEKWLREQYLVLKKTTTQIAKEVGCGSSVVFFALIRLNIPRRSRKEARKDIKFTKEHLENITKANRIMAKNHSGSNHWNWQGDKTSEYENRMAAMKRDPRYKAWRKAVVSVGYCKVCGTSKQLEAHHILPKSKFPHLIHDISNGMALCRKHHIATYTF